MKKSEYQFHLSARNQIRSLSVENSPIFFFSPSSTPIYIPKKRKKKSGR